MPVSERYQIQEIVTQDESGVLFRALDTDSGRMVGLRRFFPFGRDGGGLDAGEGVEYRRSVAQMTTLKLPTLRAVLDGGCDPVDGFPYLVTAWVEGETLADLLVDGKFEADATAGLLDQALELCERISGVLGSEALWVKTAPETIVATGAGRERHFTFGLSPIRWLVDSRDRRSLLPLVGLAEALMGWQGRWLKQQAGGGLGGFLKWLRGNAQSTSLREARLQLARLTGREAPAVAEPKPVPQAEPAATADPARHLPPSNSATAAPAASAAPAATAAPRADTEPSPILAPAERPQGNPWRWVAGLLLAIGGLTWWVIQHPAGAKSAAQAAPQSAEAKRLEEVQQLAAKLVSAGGGESARSVFAVEDRQALLNEAGKRITVEGEVVNVKASASGKTLYLEFVGCETNGIRGRVVVKDATPELTEPALRKWLSKRVRVTGTVKHLKGRPEITLADGDAIRKAP